MPLFKKSVALEACPAKTAESISYVATFAVLGWLLVNNYSGLDSRLPGETAIVDIATTNTDSDSKLLGTPANYFASRVVRGIESSLDTSVATEGYREAIGPLLTVSDQQEPQTIEVSIDTRLAELTAWHAELDLSRPNEIGTRNNRIVSRINGRGSIVSAEQSTAGFLVGLLPSPPITSTDYLLGNFALENIAADKQLASSEPPPYGEIQEVTVTAAEVERINSSATRIERPQIPRALRPQQVQRSLILPPRIQALRP